MSAEFNPNNLLSASSAQPSAMADADDLMWELLSLYADGEASPDEAAQVEQMLRHDAEYARAYSFMQQTNSVVRAIVEVEPPAFLREAILAKTSHRLTFAQRLAAGLATLRTQLAPAHTGRWALAGGSLAACALLIGVFTARPANNVDNSTTAPAADLAKASPAQTVPNSPAIPTDVNALHPPIAVPQDAIARTNTAPKIIVSASQSKAVKIDLTGLPSEPRITPPILAAADKTKTASTFGTKTNGTLLPGKPGNKVAEANPRKPLQPSGNPGRMVSESGADTQNVSPMMDANVQHQQVAMMTPDIRHDDDLDRDVITSSESGSAAMPAVASTDMDSAPRGRLVGKLQLSKLPPAARHLQTAADIQRIQEARNMGYAATAMDGMQRREADVALFSGKF